MRAFVSTRGLLLVCSSILSVSRAELCTNRCVVTHNIEGSVLSIDLNRNDVCNSGCEYGSDCADCGPCLVAAERRARMAEAARRMDAGLVVVLETPANPHNAAGVKRL